MSEQEQERGPRGIGRRIIVPITGTIEAGPADVVAEALAELPLTLTFETSISYIGNTARADVTIETTFGQLAERGELGDSQASIVETGGDLDYILSFHDLSPQSFASLLRDPLLSAVRNVTTSPVQSAMAHAGEEFDPVVSDLVDEVSGGLAPLVEALPDAASLTVNAQSEDDGSFTVSATSLALVGGSLAEIDFASSTVRATAGEKEDASVGSPGDAPRGSARSRPNAAAAPGCGVGTMRRGAGRAGGCRRCTTGSGLACRSSNVESSNGPARAGRRRSAKSAKRG